MSGQTKKFRSKFFRVAVEGDTTDGRVIERGWLQDMAESYSPNTYGARIWMEHIRSVLPDSPFRAYGDVLALKTEEVEIDGKKKLALFAQIEPTSDLVNMVNGLKQKVYTSMEIAAKFANTGKAYLVGLAVTDSPASLGTERLAFAAQHPEANLFQGRKQQPDNLYSAASEAALEFEEVIAEPSAADKLFALLTGLIKGQPGATKPEPNTTAPEQFSAINEALTVVANHLKAQGEQFAELQRKVNEQQSHYQKLQADHTALTQQLSSTSDPTQTTRPLVTGAAGNAATDC